ncbi:Protein of unknown function [Gryllus bimaculatus]|nr:Protein of unknown function [Gryllus bimaculatus]
MREVGLPCPVIMSHGEIQNSASSSSNVQEALCVQVFSSSKSNEQSAPLHQIETDYVTSRNNDSWHRGNNNQNLELSEGNHLASRVRKLKRPYSPPLSEKKSFKKLSSGKSKNVLSGNEGKVKESQSCEKPFVCGKCGSPYVVNPARCHSSAKTYTPRKIFDPIAKKTLLVCNACRLSLARSQKAKPPRSKKSPPSEEAKAEFQEECVRFSASLVEKLRDSDASRLYCPAFTLHPCKCLQNYLTCPDEEEESHRAESLLNLLKKAKQLSAQKNSFGFVQNPRPRGLLKCKSQMFEEFVQETRLYLRSQLKLCERACQRVLMYSNNFLHKHLKSAPDKRARIERLGGSSRPPLCPISRLPNESCCQERCVLMALTHSRLLEDWRTSARRSQRDARRVLAEMLTPSGGSKANCYKFIRMVTGCSQTTICLVSEQMWRTQGNREPPEHGLKNWWQKRAGLNSEEVYAGHDSAGSESCGEDDDAFEYEEEDNKEQGSKDHEDTTRPSVSDIHIPTARELRDLAPAEAGRRLLQQRHKLACIQRQLVRQQQQLEALRQQRPPIVLGCCSGMADLSQSIQQTLVQPPAAMPSVAPQAQVVHILEIPATPTTVIPSVPETCQQQPTLSVLSSSGEFEPITNISVNVAPGQPMGTVYFIPEYETVSSIPTDHMSGNNVIFTPSATEADSIQLQQNLASPSQLQPQAVHLPTMQVHLPLDIPVQLAMQPTSESSVQTEQALEQPAVQVAVHHPVQLSGPDPLPSQTQPIILPSPQPIPFQVAQPTKSSNPVQQGSLHSTPATIVNVLNKDNCSVQTSEAQVYYLESVNCVTSVPD